MPGRAGRRRCGGPVQPRLAGDQVVAGGHQVQCGGGQRDSTAGPGRPARRRAGRTPGRASSAASARWPPQPPEPGQRGAERIAVSASPVSTAESHRGDQVVPLGGEPAHHSSWSGPRRSGLGRLGDGEEVGACARLTAATSPASASRSVAVLAEGLEHPVARRRTAGQLLQQRLVDQRGQQVGHVRGLHRAAGADASAASGLTPPGKTASRSASAALGVGRAGPSSRRPPRAASGAGAARSGCRR